MAEVEISKYLRPGTRLCGGKYTIDKVLGQGGFGITYRGEMKVEAQGPLGSIQTQIPVAIKEFFMDALVQRDVTTGGVSVPSTGAADTVERYQKKFRKEAQTLAKFKHPHIVSVLDVFDENGTTYYVMEFLPGGSLSARMKRGVLPEAEARRMILQVADALRELHSRQICHLDVKPANIMLDAEGNAKLIDFGIAKGYDGSGHATTTTLPGISPGYSPPEQYIAGGVSDFSPQSDIYSLGATLVALLTGHAPQEAMRLVEGIGSCPSGVSPALWQAAAHAMRYAPSDRPATISDFIREIQPACMTADHNEKTVVVVDEKTLPIERRGDGKPESANCRENVGDKDAHKKGLTKRAIISIVFALTCIIIIAIFVFSHKSDTPQGVESIPSNTKDDNICPDSNHPHAIDLGLPSGTKWACCNVGASSPTDYGDYYAWGETKTKSEYSEKTYDYYRNGIYVNIGSDIRGTPYDAAHTKWGGRWEMPTIEQQEELIDKCEYQWTTRNDVEGGLFTGPNGRAIFLPAPGYRYYSYLYDAGSYGYYWSSAPDPSYSDGAYGLGFDGTGAYWSRSGSRHYGHSARPVAE